MSGERFTTRKRHRKNKDEIKEGGVPRLHETNFVHGVFGILSLDRGLIFLMSRYFNEQCVF